ncbi:MAG: hypothetical protein GX943_03620 [Candidatus Pacebacteria bacterium]|jgi:hypothetical protein|nr:hypothetical protein [Candidatus Paceibacterota bacterium]
MTIQQKNHLLGRRWFLAKKRLFKKTPKLLSNSKLAKRRATPDPIGTCVNQSADPQSCKKNIF